MDLVPPYDMDASITPIGGVAPQVALGSDGTIYMNSTTVVDGGTSFSGLFDAIHPDGTPSWSVVLPCLPGPPVVGLDGTIEFTCSANGRPSALYALNPDGSQKWSLTLTGGLSGVALTLGANGTAYVLTNGLAAVDSVGALLWTSDFGTVACGIPAVGGDGTIYVGTTSGFFAINPDGTQKWTSTITGTVCGSPSIASDGTVYTATSTIYAYGP